MTKIRTIAIHLPQFHPFPENDEWWGKGFTEWTNVSRAKPLFKDHYQPQIPSDLGFYDLRLDETRKDQAELAEKYGIHGFCYYHYWFKGERLMKRAIDPIIESGKPDFPFMFCWANETWSRRWLGEEKEILIKQDYSESDHLEHAKYLAQIFSDKRYIKINNRPVFIIYRPNDINYITVFIQSLYEECLKIGVEKPYLIASNSHSIKDPDLFAGVLNFEPQLGMLKDAFKDEYDYTRLWNNYKNFGVLNGKFKLYDYNEVKKLMMGRPVGDKTYPCVFVGWDNTARRGQKGIIMTNQNVEMFKKSLELAKSQVENREDDEKIIFINAWNEWAEGNHLEPCFKYGHTYLQAVKEVFG